MSAFFAAVQFLTIFPWPKAREYSADELGRAAILFPLIGFFLGIILVLLNASLEPFASAGLLSVALVAMLALLTGGLHLDGVGDSFDGLSASGDRERMLRIMDDSHTGAFGLIAIVLLLLFKVHAIESIETDRWRALLAAPVLGRWAMVLLGYRSRAAKPGLGASLVEHLKTKHVILSSFITLLLVASVLHEMGVALMIWVAVFSTVNKIFWQRRLGGVTGDTFGAVGELSETSVLVFLALCPL
ncbi:MAG TPA: adenosylcobinamide-GDP ribazoletransferase [Candidatus Binatia bacterium]|nr:adenosylcobinamide-GDP ribazoletransferase [Candidatus Binatia bacterium]